MALKYKLETDIEIKAPADKFYNIFRSQMHLIPNVSSDKIQGVQVHEGDWETMGSVKHWNYTLDGNALSLKETVEAIDVENKSITYNTVDGEVMKHYKSLKCGVQVSAKDEGSLVKWIIEYEKLNEKIPAPDAYLDLAAKVTKDVEAHLV
nr:MLP-like protein 31 [Quercus suber]POE52685.1 mlp-like protein 31 [Quercus suber]